jgi:hypothetical protein
MGREYFARRASLLNTKYCLRTGSRHVYFLQISLVGGRSDRPSGMDGGFLQARGAGAAGSGDPAGAYAWRVMPGYASGQAQIHFDRREWDPQRRSAVLRVRLEFGALAATDAGLLVAGDGPRSVNVCDVRLTAPFRERQLSREGVQFPFLAFVRVTNKH